jgi:DNA-binding transcriptional ArsR family regulator
MAAGQLMMVGYMPVNSGPQPGDTVLDMALRRAAVESIAALHGLDAPVNNKTGEYLKWKKMHSERATLSALLAEGFDTDDIKGAIQQFGADEMQVRSYLKGQRQRQKQRVEILSALVSEGFETGDVDAAIGEFEFGTDQSTVRSHLTLQRQKKKEAEAQRRKQEARARQQLEERQRQDQEQQRLDEERQQCAAEAERAARAEAAREADQERQRKAEIAKKREERRVMAEQRRFAVLTALRQQGFETSEAETAFREFGWGGHTAAEEGCTGTNWADLEEDPAVKMVTDAVQHRREAKSAAESKADVSLMRKAEAARMLA